MAGKQPVASGEDGRIPFPGPDLDMICPWAGGAVRYRPALTGPVTVPGIVLFWGAAIPGGIPHIGTVGDQSGGAEPQTLRTERLEGAQRDRIWASAEAHESGLSVRQTASATGLSSSLDPIPGLGRGPRDPPVATVSSAGRTDPTNHARRRPCPRARPTFRPALRARRTPAPVPRVAGASGPRGTGRGEPAARDRSRDRSRDGRRRDRPRGLHRPIRPCMTAYKRGSRHGGNRCSP